MASLGSLVVSLSANTAQFTSDLGKAAHISAERMEQIQKSAVAAGAAIGAAFAAGVGIATVLVKNAIDTADAMGKMAQKAGVTVEALSGMSVAAQMSDVDVATLTQSMARLGEQLADMAGGKASEAADALRAMGISASDASGQLKDSEQIILEVADKFAMYQDGAAKSALAIKVFGRSGADMIPFLNQGRDGIEELRKEAEALGLTLTDNASVAANEFNDNLTRLTLAKQGLANQIMKSVMPSIMALSGQFIEGTKRGEGFAKAAQIAASGMKILATIGAVVVGVFKTVGEFLGGFAAQMVALFSGQFKAALEIGDQTNKDVAANVKGMVTTIGNIWTDAEAKAEGQTERVSTKLAAPIVKAAEKSREAKASIVKDTVDMNAAWVRMIDDQISEERRKADEIGRTQGEIKTVVLSTNDDLIRSIEGWGRSFTNTFTDMVMSGKVSFGDLANSIIKDLLRITIQKTITDKILGDWGNGTDKGSGVLGFIGSFVGGGKALGGGVDAGTSYLVGERGPEIFQPGVSGTIIPNGGMGGGLTINQTNHFASGVDRVAIQKDLYKMKELTKAEIAAEQMRRT